MVMTYLSNVKHLFLLELYSIWKIISTRQLFMHSGEYLIPIGDSKDLDTNEKTRVNLDPKQNIQEDTSTHLRESLHEALFYYFNNLKVSSDDPLFSASMSYVEKISVRELQIQPSFLEAVRVIVYA